MPYRNSEQKNANQRKHARARRKRKIEAGECIRCKLRARPGKTLCAKHTKYAHEVYKRDYEHNPEKHSAWSKLRGANLRREVITHYGSECACCGESQFEFLTIDHVDGEGSVQRAKTGTDPSGSRLYWFLKRNEFPGGYRVLCSNCNMAMSIHGQCPHGTLPPQMTNHPANPYRKQWKEKFNA